MTWHIIMSNDVNGNSTLESVSGPGFDGQGFPAGWKGAGLEDSGVFMFLFDVAPDAVEFPVHADEAEWLAYVVSGSGTLFTGTAALDRTDGAAYETGDFITFRANTPHGWKSDGEASRILFVKRS